MRVEELKQKKKAKLMTGEEEKKGENLNQMNLNTHRQGLATPKKVKAFTTPATSAMSSKMGSSAFSSA